MGGIQRILLRARWVATMAAPPIESGAVLIDQGKVIAAGRAADIRAGSDGLIVKDFGEAIILPGLVNAHAHLELSHLTADPYGGDFTKWLFDVFRSASPTSDGAADSVRIGIDQCLRFGVTTVGDIASAALSARRALAEGQLRAVSYGEVVGMAGRRHVREPRIAAAVNTQHTSDRLRAGISPHAPYSIDADGYRRCLAAATENRLPLTTHLAESPHEAQFLSDHTGPFRTLWERIGAWDDSVPPFAGGAIRFTHHLGLLDYPLASLAHVNYCDDEELSLLAAGRASVVYCPRTHAYFGHPPHRWREMLALGINVAVGTDSCASSPDLNLVDELRLLHRVAPEVPAQVLWEMATVRAARAIGMDSQAGTLSQVNSADLVVFPVTTRDPLREILEGTALPLSVWAGGREVAGTVRAAR